MTARPIRRNAQTPDRNGKIFYTSTTSLSHISKSPHKCRKTAISTLLDSPSLNARTAQKFAGHRHLSTTYDYYSFERKTKKEQAEAINLALAL